MRNSYPRKRSSTAADVVEHLAWLWNSQELAVDRVVVYFLGGIGSCSLEHSRKLCKNVDRCLPAPGKGYGLGESVVTAHLVKNFVAIAPSVYVPLECHLCLGLQFCCRLLNVVPGGSHFSHHAWEERRVISLHIHTFLSFVLHGSFLSAPPYLHSIFTSL